jgi:gluconokinase
VTDGDLRTPLTVVVMGVSGSGKTTLAGLSPIGWVARSRRATTCTPRPTCSRWPPVTRWTTRTAAVAARRRRLIAAHESTGSAAVLTCSALRRRYRDLLREGNPSVWFAHLHPSPAVLADRLAHRTGHYMPASLLDSQLRTLEPLQDGEPGALVQVAPGAPSTAVLDAVLAALPRRGE